MNTELNFTSRFQFWPWILSYGIIMTLAGILCLIAPRAAGVAVEIIVAVTLLMAGVLNLLAGSIGNLTHRWPLILTGVIEIVLAVLIFSNPFAGLVALTAYIGIGLALQGIGRILLIYHLGGINRYLFWFLSAACGFILGVFILVNLVDSASWLLGTMCGIVFLLAGLTASMAALSLKKVS